MKVFKLNLNGQLANDGEQFASAFTGNEDFPEKYLHSNYAYSVKRAEEISVHMVYDKKPESLLKIVRPYEFDAVKQYRIDSWQPVNYSLLLKPLNFIGRIFNKNLMRVEVNDSGDSKVSEEKSLQHFLSELPIYGKFEDFLRNYLPGKLFSDPNGWLAMWPESPQYDTEGNALFDEGELPSVLPVFIPSKDVISYTKEYFIAKSSDKSEVYLSDPNVTEMTGEVYIAFTQNATFRIYQAGKKTERIFYYHTLHDHSLGELPLTKFKGYIAQEEEKTLSLRQGDIVHDSFLQPAIPHLNEYVISHSDYKAALILHLHPQYYEAATPDRKPRGNDFFVAGKDDEIFRENAEGNFEVVEDSSFNMIEVTPDENGKVHPPGGYIEGPIAIIEAMQTEIKRLEMATLGSLNMGFLAREQKRVSETGVALREEKDPLIAFLETLSAEFKRLGDWVLDKTNQLRYGQILGKEGIKEQSAIVIAPERFTVKDINEAAASLKLISESGVDKGLLMQSTLEFSEKEFGSDSKQFAWLKANVLLNPLFGYKPEEITDMLMSETIPASDYKLAINLPMLLNKAIEEDPSFLDLPINEQREVIQQLNGMDQRSG